MWAERVKEGRPSSWRSRLMLVCVLAVTTTIHHTRHTQHRRMHGLVLGLSRGSGWAGFWLFASLLFYCCCCPRQSAPLSTEARDTGDDHWHVPGACFGLGPPHGVRKGDDNTLRYEQEHQLGHQATALLVRRGRALQGALDLSSSCCCRALTVLAPLWQAHSTREK